MLTFEEAQDKAQSHLAELCREFGRDDLVLNQQFISTYPCGWVFPYNTKRYLETHFPLDGLVGNRPMFVDKENGSVHIIPTGSIERWIDEYSAQT